MKFIINTIIKIRDKVNVIWIFKNKIPYLNQLRSLEANNCIQFLSVSGNLLDFGSGTGAQAKVFSEHGYAVTALDIKSSNYSGEHIFNVEFYDGLNIPFEEDFFDVIFSSNVFEHIYDIEHTLNELSRISKNKSKMILLMPTPTWKIFTILTDLLKKWHIGKPHGEHSKNTLHEIFVFSSFWWKKKLSHANWNLLKVSKNGLFYTGNNIFGFKLSFKIRKVLSKFLGSSCNVYVLENNK